MAPSTLRPFLCVPVLAALTFSTLVVRAANVTWDGNGDAFADGLWETGVNWSTNAIPTNLDNAQLLNVTGGTREVTISSGSPQTINKLTITQTTVGAFNVLNVNDNLTIITSGGSSSPFAMAATAGQDSIVTTIADGKTLLATNSNSGMTGTLFNGTLNLGAASTFRLEALGATSDLVGATFGGPINATGAGAAIVLNAGRFVQNPVFNGAVTVSNPGSTLTLSALRSGTPDTAANVGGSLTFNGNDGSGNSVNLAAGTAMIFNVPGSTYNFTNRVNLAAESSPAAGGSITFGVVGGTQVTNFNGGLVLGAGATANFHGGSVSTNLADTSSLATGSTLLISMSSPSGAMKLTNTGGFTMDGATLKFDWAATSSNTESPTTIGRRFVNTGTWTLKNASTLAFISSTGRPVSGFAIGTNNENSGTINVESGSTLAFDSLYNTGTLNLGSSTAGVSDSVVYLGSPSNTFGNVTLFNGLTAPVPTSSNAAGTINILGNAWLGRTINSGSTTTLNNGTATSTGSIINVGNGTVPVSFTLANQTVAINNNAGNTINLNAESTLLLTSTAIDATTGNVALTNNGTFNHTGTLSMRGTFNGTRIFTTSSTGTYRINGTAAVIEALPGIGNQATNLAAVTVSVAGLLSGSTAHDTLTYTNSTGNASFNTLALTMSGGEITAGNGTNGSGASSIGTLEFVNTNITLTGATKLSFDIGGLGNDDAPFGGDSNPILTFDRIVLSASRTFALGTGAILDIWMTNGFGTETAQTYTLIDTGLGGEGSVTGSFATLLFQGQALTDNQYTVNVANGSVSITLAAGLGTPIPEPSSYAMLVAASVAGTVLMRRRRRA